MMKFILCCFFLCPVLGFAQDDLKISKKQAIRIAKWRGYYKSHRPWIAEVHLDSALKEWVIVSSHIVQSDKSAESEKKFDPTRVRARKIRIDARSGAITYKNRKKYKLLVRSYSENEKW